MLMKTTTPFKGYPMFVMSVMEKLIGALQEGKTPIFLGVGGVTPDENGKGPASLACIEEEEYEEQSNEGSGKIEIIKKLLEQNKEKLSQHSFNFVTFLVNIQELEESQIDKKLTEEQKDLYREGEEISLELEPEQSQMTNPHVQIYIRDTSNSENIWETLLPIDLKEDNDTISISFKWKDMKTKDIYLDNMSSEVLETLMA